MNKFIVTTTIQHPTKATLMYLEKKDWCLIVVGDKKTPHEVYDGIRDLIYLHPDYQEEHYKELSDAIGWNCIMRRNIGFIEAYRRGADIIASIDDDNIPYANWGEDIRLGKQTVSMYSNPMGILDPLKLTNHPELWHRGYPLDMVFTSGFIDYIGKETRNILFQANLWDGDPDVDATCRFIYQPRNLKLKITEPFSTNNFVPFNSQNTFIARDAIPFYMMLPHVGRMDDIWGGYIAQYQLDTRPLFMPATTYQKRNEQSIYKNYNDEVFGVNNTSKLLDDIRNFSNYLPDRTLAAYYLYREEYNK